MQMRVSVPGTALAAILLFSAVGFQNCSPGFQPESRQAFLSRNSVMSGRYGSALANNNDSAPEDQNDDDSTPASTSPMRESRLSIFSPTPTPTPTLTPPPHFQSTVLAICSDSFNNLWGGNVKQAESLVLNFVNDAGTVVCAYHDQNLKPKLADLRILEIANLKSNCPSLQPGVYKLELKSPTSRNLLMGVHADNAQAEVTDRVTTAEGGDEHPYTIRVVEATGGQLSLEKTLPLLRPLVFYAPDPYGPSGYLAYAETPDASGCNFAHSPLVIQITDGYEATRAIELTSPEDGIWFDILGAAASPVPHTKSKLSWFTASSASRNYFLVLPSRDGSVVGIDQLFGNSTTGPDGLMADNGYEALGKFDGRLDDSTIDPHAKDGVIDRKDKVFKRLRLWGDTNRDGIAQARELHPLDEFRIVAIDLNYDSNFLEFDRYGNETRFKSVVRRDDGRLYLIYDLWFTLGRLH